MNGAVIPNTPIAVDFWRLRQCPHSRIFFLSHMHSDHTAGLTSSWNTHTIYCSELTRKLAIANLGVKSELVVGLPIGESVAINLDEVGRETMTVTLIDANHCPGAVMFIFEGYFGRILYTGDFRFCESIAFHPTILAGQFDILYLDNTYCDPSCVFPSRAEATVEILEIIRRHHKHDVVIGLHNLGKEVLLHRIAVVFQTWIGVSPSRRETLELLEMPDVFTCDLDAVRIRVVKSNEVNKKNIAVWNSKKRTVAILPTCLYFGSHNPYVNVRDVYVVPYSDHSSFEELRKFVQVVKPRKIIPIVHKHRLSPGEEVNRRVNMDCFADLMDAFLSSPYTVPTSVAQFMTFDGERFAHRKLNVKKQQSLRKSVSSKKPCGVVFPLSLENIEMHNLESGSGNVEMQLGMQHKKLECRITEETVHHKTQASAEKRQEREVSSYFKSANASTPKKKSQGTTCSAEKRQEGERSQYFKSTTTSTPAKIFQEDQIASKRNMTPASEESTKTSTSTKVFQEGQIVPKRKMMPVDEEISFKSANTSTPAKAFQEEQTAPKRKMMPVDEEISFRSANTSTPAKAFQEEQTAPKRKMTPASEALRSKSANTSTLAKIFQEEQIAPKRKMMLVSEEVSFKSVSTLSKIFEEEQIAPKRKVMPASEEIGFKSANTLTPTKIFQEEQIAPKRKMTPASEEISGQLDKGDLAEASENQITGLRKKFNIHRGRNCDFAKEFLGISFD